MTTFTQNCYKSDQSTEMVVFLRLDQLASCKKKGLIGLTGLSRSTILKQVKLGTFPKPVRLSDRCVGWDSRSVNKWSDSRKGRGVSNHA